MSKLTTIEGIGPVMSERLEEAGITSVEALLKAGSTSAGRTDIARKIGIDASRILKFVNHADLMRINGIGGEYAELLEASGVDSVPELSHRNAENLAERMASENESRSLVRLVPSAKTVSGWVDQAKLMEKVVTH